MNFSNLKSEHFENDSQIVKMWTWFVVGTSQWWKARSSLWFSVFARSILARFGLKDDHFRYNFWIVIGCRFSLESKRVFLAFFLVWLRPGRVWWSQKPGESVFGGFELGWFYWSENARFYGIKETESGRSGAPSTWWYAKNAAVASQNRPDRGQL